MMWTVRHCWPEGESFAFNSYSHWAQLLLRQPGDLPVTILIQEGVTQGNPLSMVLYGITLVPLAKELRAAESGLLSMLYADNATFDGSARQSAQLLNLLMERGPDRGYLPEPDKSLFVLDTPGKEEAAKREFTNGGVRTYLFGGSIYLGDYLGP